VEVLAREADATKAIVASRARSASLEVRALRAAIGVVAVRARQAPARSFAVRALRALVALLAVMAPGDLLAIYTERAVHRSCALVAADAAGADRARPVRADQLAECRLEFGPVHEIDSNKFGPVVPM